MSPFLPVSSASWAWRRFVSLSSSAVWAFSRAVFDGRQLVVRQSAARLLRGQFVFEFVEIDERKRRLGIVGRGGLNLAFKLVFSSLQVLDLLLDGLLLGQHGIERLKQGDGLRRGAIGRVARFESPLGYSQQLGILGPFLGDRLRRRFDRRRSCCRRNGSRRRLRRDWSMKSPAAAMSEINATMIRPKCEPCGMTPSLP